MSTDEESLGGNDDGPLRPIAILRRLDKLEYRIADLTTAIDKARQNDERFAKMETHFNIAKWLATLALVAGMAALINGIAARISVRVSDPMPLVRDGERMGSDRIVQPAPPR